MHTENSIVIDAPAATIYALAAAIERWPEILPHYRWVTVLRDNGTRRLVEMAATRDGIPVKWVSIQECDPQRHAIHFRHVRGVTRGMDVEWSITPQYQHGESTLVRITHEFNPPWPRPVGPLIARYVVGDFFVHDIASKTLGCIKRLAEARHRDAVEMAAEKGTA